jgi:serine phosphatase RsbU (regulator of sigma subunit)/anti-sigma regulatory factor (Ser/Thr protein kinase)
MMENKRPSIWQRLFGNRSKEANTASSVDGETKSIADVRPFDMPPNDPLLMYFLTTPGAVEVDSLKLESPTLDELRAEGVKITLPLVSQGELIGLLNLGPRLSEQEYSSDDKRLLNNLATQAAPALRVAQLVRQQEREAREHERLAQELRVARIIQQTLLPNEIPALKGWKLAAHWEPAREVGGDFYDFIELSDGSLGILIADVTDKGIPAALVMATTRSLLISVIEQSNSPGEILAHVNDLLCPDIPTNMFVTCLLMILDPTRGELRFANAGHSLPLHYSKDGVQEWRATGMPLGLMPGMEYEERVMQLSNCDSLLLYSDGFSEAHNPQGEMFGTPRIRTLLADIPGDDTLIEYLFQELKRYTGPEWEQEDDVTFVTIERGDVEVENYLDEERELLEFQIESKPGNERQASARVLEVISSIGLSEAKQKKLETATAEATMNAMEHGNRYDPEKSVNIRVLEKPRDSLIVQITDQGGDDHIPQVETPDLDAKLAGDQSPRGWGLFLIKNMVDDMNIHSNEDHHTIELVVKLEGEREL